MTVAKDWRTWTRTEWGDALSRAVFRARAGNPSEVSRIDATSQFLARVAGAPLGDAERVKAAFLKTFLRDWRLSALFSVAHAANEFRPQASTMPGFAQLYLTCLAASADERTHEEGNFRQRFLELLNIGTRSQLNFGELAQLWKLARRWSHAAPSAGFTRRRLVLPDPRHEVLIGISKRLAFPPYLDQQRLAAILKSSGLDAASPVRHVQRAISSRVFEFSQAFRDEFEVFKRLIDQAELDRARQSPLWGAVSDVTWDVDDTQDTRHRLTLLLELDVADPFQPQFALWFSGDNWRQAGRWIVMDDALRPHPGYLRVCGNDGRPIELQQLITEAAKDESSVKTTKLGAAILDGCVGFSTDAIGVWLSIEEMPENQPFWLLLARRHVKRVQSVLQTAGVSRVYSRSISPEWQLLGPATIQTSAVAAVRAALDNIEFFAQRLHLESPRLVNAIRIQGKVLFFPEIAPLVRSNATSVLSWRAYFVDGASTPICQLVRDESEQTFQFGGDAASVTGEARIEVGTMDSELGNLPRALAFSATPICPKVQAKPNLRPERWLVDGCFGQLVPLNASELDCDSKPSRNGAFVEAVQDGSAIRLSETDCALEIPFDDLNPRWMKLLEVLEARFASTVILSFDELVTVIDKLWQTERGGAQEILHALVQNAFVRRVFGRDWPSSGFMRAPLRMSILRIRGNLMCRVSGILAQERRNDLVDALGSQEIRVCVGGPERIIGGLTFKIDSEDVAVGVAEALRAELQLQPPSPLPPWDAILSRSLDSSILEQRPQSSACWDDSVRRFVPIATVSDDISLVEQRYERLPTIYRLAFGDHEWVTRSRTWAVLGYAAVTGCRVISAMPCGHLCISDRAFALPQFVGDAAVLWGGGVSYKSSSGTYVYAGGAEWATTDIVHNWRSAGSMLPPIAIETRDIAVTRRELALMFHTRVLRAKTRLRS